MQTTIEKNPSDGNQRVVSPSIKSLQRRLMVAFWAVLAFVVLVGALLRVAECPSACPFLADGRVEYVADMLAVCLTVCLVPLALRLFRFERVRRQLPYRYGRWAWVRLLTLQLVLAIDAVGYGLFGQASYFYLALMTLLAMVFVYPSRRRCEAETVQDETK